MGKNQNLIQRYFEKLFVRQWTIGFFRGNISDIIRSKSFDPDIKWLPIEPFNRFFADPFLFKTTDGNYNILVEEFCLNKDYGKISLMSIDKTSGIVYDKVLLDTKNHLSYPFIYKEDDKIYVFPEAGETGKLLCYEFDPLKKSLIFLKAIIDKPVVDPTILKYNNKYWLFGTLKGHDSFKKLYIYFSDNLLGPYQPHPQNPVKNALNNSRPAGNFIEVDGIIYRPAQNRKSENESITINKIKSLDEFNFCEEPYMLLSMNKANRSNGKIHSVHTINVEDNIIVIDGKEKKFAPLSKLMHTIKKRFALFQAIYVFSQADNLF